MAIPDLSQANCLLEKLPSSWETFIHSLKHRHKDFNLHELVSHIKIEERNCIQIKGKSVDHSSSYANLVENKVDAGKGSKGKDPNQFHGTRQNYNMQLKGIGKFKGSCFICGKYGHVAKDCSQRKEVQTK